MHLLLLLSACTAPTTCRDGFVAIADGVCAPAGADSADTGADDTDSGDTDSGDTDSGDTDSGDTDSGDTDSGDTDPATFTDDVYPIYRQDCSDCHEGWGGDGTAASAYAAILAFDDPNTGRLVSPGDREGSAMYTKLAGTAPGDRMPLQTTPLSADEVARLGDWITAGAPNDATFEAAVATPFRSHHCISCHIEFQGGAGLYTTLMARTSGSWQYIVPGDPLSSLYYLKVASSEPPFGSGMPLEIPYRSDAEIARLGAWIDAGAAFP